MRHSLPSLLRYLGLTALAALGYGMAVASTPMGAVAGIAADSVADLVVVAAGSDVGFRSGMVCRVTRGRTEVGELVLVEVRPSCSSGLITSLARSQSVRAGDSVTSKLLKS